MSEKTTIEKGKVLMAEPFSEDTYFRRAVVLVCENHPQGTLGFIINKVTDLAISDLIEDFPPFEGMVYYGGPVQTDRLHFLHNLGDLLNESTKVSDGVYWGGDFKELKFLIQNEMVTPDNVRFFVGYAGWSDGQLDEELTTGSWVTSDMHANYLFKLKPDDVWKQAMYNKGNTFEILADIPDEELKN